MAGFFEKRRQERAEREAMKSLVSKAAQEEMQRAQEFRRRALNNIIITPESKNEYASSVGYDVERIALPNVDKGVVATVLRRSNGFWIMELTDEGFLFKEGISAIVNATYSKVAEVETRYAGGGAGSYLRTSISEFYYGIPVRRKR
jgi:hypothetical protein